MSTSGANGLSSGRTTSQLPAGNATSVHEQRFKRHGRVGCSALRPVWPPPVSGAEPLTTPHAGLRIELIPQPPVATRASPVPQGEDHREGHIAERQQDQYGGNNVAEMPEERLEPSEDGNEGETEQQENNLATPPRPKGRLRHVAGQPWCHRLNPVPPVSRRLLWGGKTLGIFPRDERIIVRGVDIL